MGTRRALDRQRTEVRPDRASARHPPQLVAQDGPKRLAAGERPSLVVANPATAHTSLASGGTHTERPLSAGTCQQIGQHLETGHKQPASCLPFRSCTGHTQPPITGMGEWSWNRGEGPCARANATHQVRSRRSFAVHPSPITHEYRVQSERHSSPLVVLPRNRRGRQQINQRRIVSPFFP
jgi:hypothetical protein